MPKSQRFVHQIEISKILGINLKMRCIDSKWSNAMNCKEAKWKASSYVIIFLWEVIYVHFYNWNRPLDLVLIVYDLIELIIEVSLKTKNYSTFDTHTQHTCLMFNECLIHLFDCTCLNVMCVCSTMYGSIQKDFWSFYMFLEVICITLCVNV